MSCYVFNCLVELILICGNVQLLEHDMSWGVSGRIQWMWFVAMYCATHQQETAETWDAFVACFLLLTTTALLSRARQHHWSTTVHTDAYIWSKKYTTQFSSVASAVQLAETVLSEWNVFCAWYCTASECDPNCSRACFVHRESGRALKLLCQLSAWVHHIQQRRSCRGSWNACRCSVRLDPRAWTTTCDIMQARASQRNLLPVFNRRDIWPSGNSSPATS